MSASELKIIRPLPEKGKHAPTSFEVNGVNIANVITSYTLVHDVGGAVTCLVTLIVGSMATNVGVENVRVDDATAEALAALGYVRKDDVRDALAVALTEAREILGSKWSTEPQTFAGFEEAASVTVETVENL
jgi:hypothetical protein